MKKFTMIIFLCLLLVSIECGAATTKYELNFAAPYADRHGASMKFFKPWIEDLKKQSNGQIDITFFAPNTICPDDENMESVIQGTVALAGNTFSRVPGRMIAAELSQLPMINSDIRTHALAWMDVVKTYPQLFPEFSKVKLLFCWCSPMSQINTVKKPVRTLEDLKGLRLIVWSAGNAEVVRALGATPLLMPVSDTYMALERGMADGTLGAIAPLRSSKLTDILRFHTIANVNTAPFWVGINQDLYNSMPQNLQKIIEESSGANGSEHISNILNEMNSDDIEWIQQQGKAQIITLEEAERERWKNATSGLYDQISAKLESNGIPSSLSKEVFDYYLERIAFHTKTN